MDVYAKRFRNFNKGTWRGANYLTWLNDAKIIYGQLLPTIVNVLYRALLNTRSRFHENATLANESLGACFPPQVDVEKMRVVAQVNGAVTLIDQMKLRICIHTKVILGEDCAPT